MNQKTTEEIVTELTRRTEVVKKRLDEREGQETSNLEAERLNTEYITLTSILEYVDEDITIGNRIKEILERRYRLGERMHLESYEARQSNYAESNYLPTTVFGEGLFSRPTEFNFILYFCSKFVGRHHRHSSSKYRGLYYHLTDGDNNLHEILLLLFSGNDARYSLTKVVEDNGVTSSRLFDAFMSMSKFKVAVRWSKYDCEFDPNVPYSEEALVTAFLESDLYKETLSLLESLSIDMQEYEELGKELERLDRKMKKGKGEANLDCLTVEIKGLNNYKEDVRAGDEVLIKGDNMEGDDFYIRNQWVTVEEVRDGYVTGLVTYKNDKSDLFEKRYTARIKPEHITKVRKSEGKGK